MKNRAPNRWIDDKQLRIDTETIKQKNTSKILSDIKYSCNIDRNYIMKEHLKNKKGFSN